MEEVWKALAERIRREKSDDLMLSCLPLGMILIGLVVAIACGVSMIVHGPTPSPQPAVTTRE